MRTWIAVPFSVLCGLGAVLGLANEPAADSGGSSGAKRTSLRITPDPLGRFRKGLEKRVKLDFEEAPLERVIAHLAKEAGFAMRIDESALEEEGIPLDEPVTIRSRAVPIATALERMLPWFNLEWVLDDGEFVVTSSIVAEESQHLVLATYDVRSILAHPPRQERMEALFGAPRTYPVPRFEPGHFGGVPGSGGFSFGAALGGLGGPELPEDFPPHPSIDWGHEFRVPARRDRLGNEWLQALIEETVAWPEHWEIHGGPATIWDLEGRYRVRHVLWAHEELDELLGALADLARGQSESVVRPFESPEERRIRLALDKRINVRFENTPLDEFVAAMGEKLAIDVDLDEITLEEEGIPQDEPVTVVAEDTIVRSLLNRVFEPLNLEWHIDADRLRITSTVVADDLGNLTVAFVDARDLMPSVGGVQSLIDAIVFQTGPPESWEDQGGPGSVRSIMGGVLVVRQHEDVVREIGDLVASLRRTANDHPPKPMPKAEDVRLLDYTFTQHDPAEVRELVEAAIDGEWNDRDWTRVVGRQLFVKTTLANHLEITRLLGKLKPVKDEPEPKATDRVDP